MINWEEQNYEYNLFFYTVLKKLIQSRLSEYQLVDLKKEIKSSDSIDEIEYKIDEEKITSADRNIGVLKDLLLVVREFKIDYFEVPESLAANDENAKFNELKRILIHAIDLMSIKSVIVEEAKMISVKKYEKLIEQDLDLLSIKYDSLNLKKPYGTRVAAMLVVYAFANGPEILIKENDDTIKEIRKEADKLREEYDINIGTMYSLIINESVNQSITTGGGDSYEKRIKNILVDFAEEGTIKQGTHDTKNVNVEYDFEFELEDKKFGISAKRTTRERYKQNMDSVDQLEVDILLLVTLGTDLNESKVRKVEEWKGVYIVVADEIYQQKEYLRENNRVISSKDFNRETLLEKYMLEYN